MLMARHTKSRRAMLTTLGAAATATALGARSAAAADAPRPLAPDQNLPGAPGAPAAAAEVGPMAAASFTPTLHADDAWMSTMRGKHRVVLDVVSPDGVPDAMRFAGNLFNGHKNGYGVDEADVAIILCLRHAATAYGYGDAIWKKYGKTLDARSTPTPTANPYNFADLTKRGVQFMVCGTASRGIASRIAGPGGDVEAVLAEMRPHVLPSGRIVAAGVVGVVHAQERGFSLIYVG
jgi:intracellular sulfur oxidation DsrE/DsrF family protein